MAAHAVEAAASFVAMVVMLAVVIVMMTDVAIADPILAPDLQYCHLPENLPPGEPIFDCCAPNWDKPAIAFQFNESAPYNLKVRRPAHAMDAEYAAKVDKAYGLMKALPSDDPRSFMQQANIHCAYCDATYQMGNSSTLLQVHSSWLFFSFHRWYLYFHERILAALLEDDSFALPFWNYDHPDGMTFPDAYTQYPNLTDDKREPSHLPPTLIKLDFDFMNESGRTHDEQVANNLAAMYRMVVSGATTQYSFFGQPYRKDDAPEPGYGTIEMIPHNSVHGWTGDLGQLAKKDMGTLYAAGRDPVFYTHHASLDRFWDVWKSLNGNEDIGDPDYLESEFVFYNENAELVKVKIKDSFDTTKLGYVYEDVENLWLNVTTTKLSDGIARLSGSERVCVMGEELVEPCSIVLSRDKEGALIAEEMIVIEGIEGVLNSPAHFEAYVNYPEASLSTMISCTEYAGRFSTLPQMVITNLTGNYRNTSIHFAIGSNIQELGLGEEESVIVTLVPRVESPYHPVTIASIKLHYETQGLSKRRREGLMPHGEAAFSQ